VPAPALAGVSLRALHCKRRTRARSCGARLLRPRACIDP
jgi:hypothetical protein